MSKLYAHDTDMGLLVNDKPRSIKSGVIYCSLLELQDCIRIENLNRYDNEKIQLIVTFDTNKVRY